MRKISLLFILALAFLSCEKETECYYVITHWTHEKGSDIYNVVEVSESKEIPVNFSDGDIDHIYHAEEICD